jgi:putative ABC transport system ATP-binding protein
MAFIELDDISRTYGQGEAAVEALRGASFGVEQGEFVALMGPSGSGKSTLLSVLGGLNHPSSGSYKVDGMDIYSLNSDQRADFRREYLGFVFQSFHLVPYLTLAENVMLPLAIKRLSGSEKLDLARLALERVGLGDKLDRLPSQISGGEQERTAVARALVNRPTILLADEPTGNLDAKNSRQMMELLSLLGDEGMTIVMVTHSADCAAYAARKLEVCDGVVTEAPPPVDLEVICATSAISAS